VSGGATLDVEEGGVGDRAAFNVEGGGGGSGGG